MAIEDKSALKAQFEEANSALVESRDARKFEEENAKSKLKRLQTKLKKRDKASVLIICFPLLFFSIMFSMIVLISMYVELL